jgi:hypothetical protein
MKKNDLKDARKVMKGMVDEARLQAHLGVLELTSKVAPYLNEVGEASRGAAKDLERRGKALSRHLKELKARR